jgi:hypothetical protein
VPSSDIKPFSSWPSWFSPSVGDDTKIARCFSYKRKNYMPGTAVKLLIYIRDISGSNLGERRGY